MKKKTLLTLVLAFAATMWTGMANAQSLNSGKSGLTGKCADKNASAKAPIQTTAESYDLCIAGEFVNSDNCADLSVIDGVTGKVSYDPKSNTLTLEDATIESYFPGVETVYVDAICNIVVKGTVNIVSTDNSAMELLCDITITGDGTLNTSAEICGITIYKNLTIDGCTVNAEGKWGGISGSGGSMETLTINKANVTAKSPDGSIDKIVSLTLNDCVIDQPKGAAYDASLGAVAVDGVVVTDKVVIIPKNYGLYIAGVAVTDDNRADLSVIDGVSGTVIFDPSNSTLYLIDASINCEGIIGIETTLKELDLNIVVKGNSEILSYNKYPLWCSGNVTISGGGKLEAFGWIGIVIKKALTINDCSVVFDGDYSGIYGMSYNEENIVTINNSNVRAAGYDTSGDFYTIYPIDALILRDCKITDPEGARYDLVKGGVVYNDELIVGSIEITRTDSGITSPIADTVSSHMQGIYNLQGMRINKSIDALPAGIYIVDGKKIIK